MQLFGILSQFAMLVVLLLKTLTCISYASGVKLDASYLHNVPATKIAQAVESSMGDVSAFEGGEVVEVEVDVSGSVLGNDGIQLVLDSIMSKPRRGKAIQLISRMNRISLEGATNILTKLVDQETGDNIISPPISFHTLDLGWNQFSDSADNQQFLKSLRLLLECPNCPSLLRLDACGLDAAACRSIGKGLINRHEKQSLCKDEISLHLCMNIGIGDAGVAALAAAIRTIALSEGETGVVLKRLDLSSCGITDAGAFALAQALESSATCVLEHLDLSNNKIGEEGATAIGRALVSADHRSRSRGPGLLSLNLSGNKDINDRGVVDLALAMETGRLPSLVLRSCNVQADGAGSFGKSLRRLCNSQDSISLSLDLSGNPLGVLRGKQKEKGKYSASNLKSKASATAASYFGIFKRGLKDVGVDFGSTLESDDEQENDDLEEGGQDTPEARQIRCGIKSLTNALLNYDTILDEDQEENVDIKYPEDSRVVYLGLRHCFLDYGAADALAALTLGCRDELSLKVSLELDMNSVLEEDTLEALQCNDPIAYEDTLQEMAERYNDAVDALNDARRRATEAEISRGDFWPEDPDLDGGFVDSDRASDENYDISDDYDY